MTFQEPPRPGGSVQEQLTRQYSYLFQMAQQLNVVLSQLEAETVAAVDKQIAGGEKKQAAQQSAQVQNLKALIVKSADEVRQEMDKLKTTLSGQYLAQSDFGTYLQHLNATLEADPSSITQYYSFYSQLAADTAAVDEAFSAYRTETEGYIRTGIVEYDGETPLYGVAVGQGLLTKTVTLANGSTATEIEPKQFRSVFTAQKLSFYQDEREVAYLSNQRLYITDAQITGRLYFGDNWEVNHDSGLTLKWIGG